MQPPSHPPSEQLDSAPADELRKLQVALEQVQGVKAALEVDNHRLRTALFKKSSDWESQREETLRLEKEAQRAKVRSGETPVEPVSIGPLNQLLVEDTPEGERAALWLEALEEVDWAVPEKAFVQALGLAADYRLNANSQIGRKVQGQSGTLRALLKFKLEQATDDRIIDTGKDGTPVLTELGDFFVKQLQETFGAAALSGSQPHDPADKRPDWEIPSTSMTGPATELFDLMVATENPTVFAQGQALVECFTDKRGRVGLNQIKPNRMISLVEEFVRPYVWRGKPPRRTYSRLKRTDAEPLLEIPGEIAKLPHLTVLANAPVMIETTSGTAEILGPGYHRDSGIYVIGGDVVKDIGVKEAVEFLMDLYVEFSFATEADRSRAIAETITPALVLGDTLGGRPAVDVAEADQSQAGKGYRQRITGATYHETFANIVDKATNGGVGSLDESFDSALVQGNHFIRIDNFRVPTNRMRAVAGAPAWVAMTPLEVPRDLMAAKPRIFEVWQWRGL